jgi:hypothetical protein
MQYGQRMAMVVSVRIAIDSPAQHQDCSHVGFHAPYIAVLLETPDRRHLIPAWEQARADSSAGVPTHRQTTNLFPSNPRLHHEPVQGQGSSLETAGAERSPAQRSGAEAAPHPSFDLLKRGPVSSWIDSGRGQFSIYVNVVTTTSDYRKQSPDGRCRE